MQYKHPVPVTAIFYLAIAFLFWTGVALAEFGPGEKLLPPQASASDRVGRSVAFSGDGNTLLIGAASGFIGSDGPGAAYVYIRAGSRWVQQDVLVPSDSSAADQFGEAVDINSNGNTAVIGSWRDDGSVGAVYVFQRTGSTWVEQVKLTPADLTEKYFGSAVSISRDGTRLAVGSPRFELGGSGAARLYRQTSLGWTAEQRLGPGGAADPSGYGNAVALDADGDTLAVANKSNGDVHIYTRSSRTWSMQKKLSDDHLGSSVDLSDDGNVLVAGANTVWVGSGSAGIFNRSGSKWQRRATLVSPEPENGDWFAESVSISANGQFVVVGANFVDVSPEVEVGAAYAYARVGGSWGSAERIIPTEPRYNDEFGNSVSLSGDGSALLVGAHNTHSLEGPPYRGAAYVYGRAPGVGGSVTGLEPPKIRCYNLTSQQSVEFQANGIGWDCEAEGLEVETGDSVIIRIRSTAE